MAGKYNFIYEKLVTAEDDLMGLIAYGIYKKHKIEFITKIKEEQQRDPTDEECHAFFIASTTDTQLENYRIQAETLLSEMVGNIAREEIAGIEKEMLKNYKQEISSCVPSNKKSFWISMGAGVVSAFVFSLIAALFYFMGETSERTTRDNTHQIMEMVQMATSSSSDSISTKK